jgi:catalase
MQRDGHMQMQSQNGRVAYTPSLIDPTGPREHSSGFRSFTAPIEGAKVRERSATFSDHYSQARQFFMSQTECEQNHIISALIFELSKVETEKVRSAMLGHLVNIDKELGNRVATGLGHEDIIVSAKAAVPARIDLQRSPSLSILSNGPPTLAGRVIGIPVTDGASSSIIDEIIDAASAANASVKIIASKLGGVMMDNGNKIKADFQLAGGPSVLFDTVAIIASAEGVNMLLNEAHAITWVHDAFAHLKVIGHSIEAIDLRDAAALMQMKESSR